MERFHSRDEHSVFPVFLPQKHDSKRAIKSSSIEPRQFAKKRNSRREIARYTCTHENTSRSDRKLMLFEIRLAMLILHFETHSRARVTPAGVLFMIHYLPPPSTICARIYHNLPLTLLSRDVIYNSWLIYMRLTCFTRLPKIRFEFQLWFIVQETYDNNLTRSLFGNLIIHYVL